MDTTEAVEEASFIVSACSEYNISLPLAIDVESAGNGSGLSFSEGSSGGMSGSILGIGGKCFPIKLSIKFT